MTAINQSRAPGSTTEQARQQASRVGHQTAQAGSQVGHAVAEQSRHVADEARHQAQHLTTEAGSQLRDQARSQKHRAAEGLRGIGRELGDMAGCKDSGMAGEAVRRASDVVQRAAGWLDEREPADLLHDVRGYARKHPGTFLAGAAVAGLLVGRLTRNMASNGNGKHADAQRGQIGQQGQGMPPMPEADIHASYSAEGPYSGVARAQNVSPAVRESGLTGRVAP
ncbi:hypothetical protein ACFOOK_19255 [Micromonospora krabiensis]|uniref:DUF3618 domain-containing protein n=1 Tax=Micromonospora krabiensis TaxID=307121 RepID=A0A1C3N9Q3_9ACTN|nr:hypothetical protein [Micromonospora krabiensis]SBV29289.1 hypothetical protein GA0070620_4861 [Micromonospora krabiensis]